MSTVEKELLHTVAKFFGVIKKNNIKITDIIKGLNIDYNNEKMTNKIHSNELSVDFTNSNNLSMYPTLIYFIKNTLKSIDTKFMFFKQSLQTFKFTKSHY